jgi:hypothetical protein
MSACANSLLKASCQIEVQVAGALVPVQKGC